MLFNSDIALSGSYSKSKISDNDCLLIYSYSSLVNRVLLEAAKKYSNLHVIVVDSRPKLKGKKALEELVKHGINCTYVLINAISFVMNKVNKVLLGSHALLANGYVMSTIGSSQIALVAKSFNVPVVVCCETYKFCEKVQTDALVYNELGNPNELLTYSNSNAFNKNQMSRLVNELDSSDITLLNLTYDVTPPDLISCVVTDMGMLPCTSVPVVLRLKNRDNKMPFSQSTQSSSIKTNIAASK
jgi:translation initiation factor eIF-2B subunit delta